MIMGIVILAIVIILMLFGFGERLFERTGLPPWLAFVISAVFFGAFFIPEIVFDKISINVAGFILPIASAILFSVLIGLNLDLLRSFFAMLCVAAIILVVRILCLDLGERSVTVSTLVAGFLNGLVAFFIAGKTKGLVGAVFGGAVLGDASFALVDYCLYGADKIYLGERGTYNIIVIGAVFGLIVSALLRAIIGTFKAKRKNKRLDNTEAAQDNDFDDKKSDEYNSFFDDEII